MLSGPGRAELARQVWPRFSTAALASVGVLVVAGVIGSLQHVDGWSELWETTYGRLLLAKIGIALVLIGFGVANRRMVRRLRERGEEGGLRRSVLAELVLMAAAISVTSVLINKPPAKAVAAAQTGRRRAWRSTICRRGSWWTRPRPGRTWSSVFLSRQGQPASADEVSVTATPPADVGPFRLQTSSAETGHYVAPPLQASVAGVWTFEIAVRRGEFDLKAAIVSIPIRNAR